MTNLNKSEHKTAEINDDTYRETSNDKHEHTMFLSFIL